VQCRHCLGIGIQGQVALFIEDQIFQGEAIVAQQEIALVQPVLPDGRRGSLVFEGRIGKRREGAVVDAGQM
jgi:hypothetical protein